MEAKEHRCERDLKLNPNNRASRYSEAHGSIDEVNDWRNHYEGKKVGWRDDDNQ